MIASSVLMMAVATSGGPADIASEKGTGVQAREVKVEQLQKKVVRTALSRRGSRYVAGRSGPWSFDCSGFTMWVYGKATKKRLPHYSGSQMSRGKKVGRKHLRPGDLMFYGPGGSQHVSLYIGRKKMIHATNPRQGVVVESINNPWWTRIYVGARRILN